MLIENAVNSYMGATPSPVPEPEWQPPTDWKTVDDPGPYELCFLVAKEGSFTFGVDLYEPDFSYRTECTVDWDDGTIENFNKYNRPEHSYTNGGMFLVKITLKDNIPCLFNGFYDSAPVLIAKFGDEILTNNEANGGSVFDRCAYYIKQIKIGGKDGIQAQEFYGCRSLQKFEITTPLKEIPDSAFYGCYSLKAIDLSQVSSIGKNSFSLCKSFSRIDIPNVVTIGQYAFNGCENLKSINAPSLTTIDEQAFYDCNRLNNIIVPNLISIGEYAFYRCLSLQSIDLPMLTEISNNAFYMCCGLKTINVTEVTKIGDYAFYKCSSLNSVDMPNVTTVGKNAFNSSAVSKVNMPSCTSIGDYGFSYCYNLDSPKDLVVAENCTYGNYCFYEVVIYPPIA